MADNSNEIIKSYELSYLEYQSNSAESFYKHYFLGFLPRMRVNHIIKKLSEYQHKNNLVVDVGCEAGYMSIKLAEAGFNVVGFDVCKEAVSDFKKKTVCNPTCTITNPLLADAYSIPLKASTCDVIVCSEVIPLLHSLNQMFEEFARILKKDGLIVLSFGNQKNRRKLFPILKLAGMDVEAVDKTFPYAHSLKDISATTEKNFVIDEVDMFPSKLFTLNTIIVLRRK